MVKHSKKLKVGRQENRIKLERIERSLVILATIMLIALAALLQPANLNQITGAIGLNLSYTTNVTSIKESGAIPVEEATTQTTSRVMPVKWVGIIKNESDINLPHSAISVSVKNLAEGKEVFVTELLTQDKALALNKSAEYMIEYETEIPFITGNIVKGYEKQADGVSGLGVAPSSIDIIFSPDSQHLINLTIINNEDKDMTLVIYAEGELAQYISIQEPLIQMSSSEAQRKTAYMINLPDKLEKQGRYETNIVIMGIPEKHEEETPENDSLIVTSKLKVFVPYTGKYAEIKIVAPHFELNKQGNFDIEVSNLGTEKILTGYVVINVYGPLNNKLKTLIGEEFSLDSKQKAGVLIPWTPDIGSGEYVAEATLVYDEFNTKDRKPFTLGEFSIEIESISVENFRLGGIAKFDILLANNWNTQIPDVYVVTTITDSQGKECLSHKKTLTNISAFWKESFEVNWDTTKTIPGNYKMDLALNYLGKTSSKLFDIKLEQNRIIVSPLAAPPANNAVIKIIYMLIILVLVLIVSNVLLLLRSKKRGLLSYSY